MSIIFPHQVFAITICDSVASFGIHRGWTYAVASGISKKFSITVNGQTTWTAAVITLYNGAGGMTVHADPLHPDFSDGSDGSLLQGRIGFTPKGGLIDAFEAVGRHDAANRTYIAEYGMAATTAAVCNTTKGAWSYGMPTVDTATAQAATPGTGYTYGCPTGNIGLGGQADKDHQSMWLQKQEWLQKPGFENDRYRDWNLCDMLAHAPGKVVVLCDLPGNDILDATQSGAQIVDPFTGAWDPSGNIEARWNQMLNLAGDSGALHDIWNTVYTLRPDAEIIWFTPPNFAADEPRWSRNPNFVQQPQASFKPPNAAGEAVPPGHFYYSTAERYWDRFVTGIPQSFVQHSPHTFTPNPPDPNYLPPYDSPYNMPNQCQFPGGPTGTALPFRISNNLIGFHRMVLGWGPVLSTRDRCFPYLQAFWGHYIADNGFWQHHRGEPSGIFLGIGATYNWILDNNSRWSGFGITSPLFPNRTWAGIYGQVSAWLTDLGTVVNEIVFGGLGGFTSQFINFNQVVTVLTKDITATNMARTLRDEWIPRQQAAETYWRGQGKKFTSLYTCDAIDGGPDGCSFDPNVPVGKIEDFVDSIHPSSLGNPIWMREVATQMLARSYTYSGGVWADDFFGRRDERGFAGDRDDRHFAGQRDHAHDFAADRDDHVFAGRRTKAFAGITTNLPEERIS